MKNYNKCFNCKDYTNHPLFNLVGVPAVIFDNSNKKFLEVNEAFLDLLGYSKEFILNCNYHDIVIDPTIDEAIQKSISGNKQNNYQNIYKKSNGDLVYLVWNGTNTDINGVSLGIARDITEEIKVKTQLNNFFKMSVDLLGIANFDGHFIAISDSWTEKTGYTKEFFLNNKFIDFIHPLDIDATLKEYEKVKSGAKSLSFYNRYKTKYGNYIALDWNSKIDLENNLIYCVARDITPQNDINKLKNLHRKIFETLDNNEY